MARSSTSFKPGESGNPRGRPLSTFSGILRQFSEQPISGPKHLLAILNLKEGDDDAVQFCERLLKGVQEVIPQGEPITLKHIIVYVRLTDALTLVDQGKRTQSIDAIIERLEGKPTQQIILPPPPRSAEEMTDAQLVEVLSPPPKELTDGSA